MPIAVTGASGLLGRAVVRRLVSLGVETIAVARAAAEFPDGVRVSRVSEYGAVPEAELDELLGRYEWFALARLVRLRQRGGHYLDARRQLSTDCRHHHQYPGQCVGHCVRWRKKLVRGQDFIGSGCRHHCP